MHGKYTFRLPVELVRQLDARADITHVPRVQIVEIALESFLSEDGADRLEAALTKRLDRMTRAVERLERHSTITNETLALFVRFWLTHTPPLPDTAQTAAQIKGRERYEAFIEAVGRRLAHGTSLLDELTREIEPGKSRAGPTK